jgi:hypothetical protein
MVFFLKRLVYPLVLGLLPLAGCTPPTTAARLVGFTITPAVIKIYASRGTDGKLFDKVILVKSKFKPRLQSLRGKVSSMGAMLKNQQATLLGETSTYVADGAGAGIYELHFVDTTAHDVYAIGCWEGNNQLAAVSLILIDE